MKKYKGIRSPARGSVTFCSKDVAPCNLPQLLAITLIVLAAAGCAHPHLYYTQTSEAAPRVGELVLPVAIGIDGPTVRWRCTYASANTAQRLTVEQSAPFCQYYREIPGDQLNPARADAEQLTN